MLRAVMLLGLAGMTCLSGLAQSDTVGLGNKAVSSPTAVNNLKRFYLLSFVVEELENGRAINSRSYTLIMHESGAGSIRAGEKVPFSSTSGVSTQWQQIDVGVNIDCRGLEITPSGVSLGVKAEISSVMESHGSNAPPPALPIIRNNQWESTVLLPLKQPTTLFSSDDPASKRTMQLQLTITPIH